MRFVVTGTGRSGTGYAAALFNAAGLRCGHEAVFRAQPAFLERAGRRTVLGRLRAPVGRMRESAHRLRNDYDGDASWMAVPRLDRFRGLTLLQTRHPLPVIRSFMGTRFFSNPDAHQHQRGYAAAHFDMVGDDVIDGMRWWTYWNDRAARHADVVYAIETIDAALVEQVLRLLDEPDVERRAARAVQTASPGVNSAERRGVARGRLAWSDLPSGADRDELAAAAARFGYDPDDETTAPLPVAVLGRNP